MHSLFHLYFLFNDNHILPLFLNSLQPDYARFYDKYNYLEFVSKMPETRYDILASFLLSYLNKHSYTLFISFSVLFHMHSLDEFMSIVRSLHNPTALQRKDLASDIHFS